MNIRENERTGKAGDMSVHETLCVCSCLCLSGSGLHVHCSPHLSALNRSPSTCVRVCACYICVCTWAWRRGEASEFRHAVCFSGDWHDSPLVLQLFLFIHKHDIRRAWIKMNITNSSCAPAQSLHGWCRFSEYSWSSIRWQPHFFGSQVNCHEARTYLPIYNNKHIEQRIKL